MLETLIYTVAAVLAVGVPVLYVLRERRKHRAAAATLEKAIERGLDEPVSLHPYIDPSICIGTAASLRKTVHAATGSTPGRRPPASPMRARYSLTGKHVSVVCDRCHHRVSSDAAVTRKIQKKANAGTYARYSGLEFRACADCHQDPHAGRFGPACGDCHTTEGFVLSTGAAFNHARTGFPLEGAHAGVACRRCHTSGRMTDPLKHERCTDCHHDYHRGRCHAPQVWHVLRFDHNTDARFALDGAHATLACAQCHRPETPDSVAFVRYRPLPHECRDCHSSRR